MSAPDAGRLEGVVAAQKGALERILRGDDLADALGDLVTWIEAASSGDVAGSILLLEGDRLRHCAAPTLPESYSEAIDGIAIGPSVGSCGTAAFTRKPVVVTDIATDPLWADFRDLALAHGLRACWSTPIVDADGTVLGTFAMYDREPRGPSPEDHELVGLCVRTAAVAIAHARARDEDRRVRERLRLALAAGGLGAWEWDLRRASVTWDPMLEAIYGMQPGEFTGDVEDYRERIHPDDRAAWRATVERARAEGTPYEVEHRIVHSDGTVRWTRGWAAPRFDESGLAGFTGVVADITEHKRAEQEREQLLRSLALTARTLQQSLLPPVPPQIPGVEVATCYHPAVQGLEVGGDFYDLPQLGRNAWGFILGDVCGKGAEAAALTALVRYAARTAATRVSSPARVLQLVNDVMVRDQQGSDAIRFATAVLARLRPDRGSLEVTLASAGHPLPLVLRADGRVEQPGQHGPLLGVFEHINPSNVRFRLDPGDALLAVTDGVLEARNVHHEELGDHLAELLAAHAGAPAAELASVVEEAALGWSEAGPRDDIAIVVLRVPT